MDKLDNSKKQTIELLQEKVEKYQKDFSLCGDLRLEQYTILAELQVIYNTLSNKTLSNLPSLYNTTCKGVKDEMEQFTLIYAKMEAEDLYENYIEKYRKAKAEPYKLTEL